MNDDWDLQAVVRSCSASTATSSSAATANTTNTTTTTTGCSRPFEQDYIFPTDVTHFSRDLFEGKTGNLVEELHDLYKPFYPKPLPISPLSVLGGLQDLSYEQNQQQVAKQQLPQPPQQPPPQIKPRQQQQQAFTVVHGSTPKVNNPTNPRSKRRKNNMKRVCHVAAENLSSDMWSWRKYGQKPIKGSPYPRGYYRCSTSKGCMARKQVERNRSDPGMFIVTYTAEHNHPMPTHRNSLAGSTRNKPAEVAALDDTNKPSCSAEMSPAASHSPALEKMESSRDDMAEAEDEDDDFSVSNMALDDDFFTGLEDFTGGECLSDSFPASSPLPWIGTTTAG